MNLVSLVVAAVLAVAPAQDKITLTFNPKQGDKLSKVEKSEMSMKATVSVGGQDQKIEFGQRESEQSSLEFIQVAGGAVVKAVLTCKEDVEEKKGPQAPDWERTEKPLHGRKITMSMTDGKLVTEGADGLDDKTKKKLDLNDRTSRLYPKTPVGPGDSWEVARDDVRAFLADEETLKDAKIKVTFVEIKDVDGRRCAVLNALMEISGKAPGEIDIAIKMDAQMTVWIDRGYALTVKGKGTMTMNAANDQFKMKGEGPMTMEITTKAE
ncbi:MAG TPA: hypothetical protein VKW04_18800 [Planctomycetota bacterium]|nr:hypothetical protein [Planctomycetota bacterium]